MTYSWYQHRKNYILRLSDSTNIFRGRTLSDAYLHVPLCDRVYQGRAGGFRARHAVQYGPAALCAIHHHRHRVHAPRSAQGTAVSRQPSAH